MNELVSILIPAHNAAMWLKDSVGSALAQQWHPVEVVIVDDGSTDDTLAVARTLATPRVTVITQPNRGAAAARNTALSRAQGDYIQWLDADDVLAPDKISRQLNGAEPGFSSRRLLTGPFGEFLREPGRAVFAPTGLWRDLEPIDYFIEKFTTAAWFFPGSWLVSRRLTEIAGPWDESLSLDDDGEYFARLVGASEGVHFVDDAHAYYRRGNASSLSRSISEKAADSLLRSIRLCIMYLLALEDSPRARAASLAFLQQWVDRGNCFHPDRAELFDRLQSLARELGGTIRSPELSWKYTPVRAIFGWSAVRRVRSTISGAKLRARITLERFRSPPSGRTRSGSCWSGRLQ